MGDRVFDRQAKWAPKTAGTGGGTGGGGGGYGNGFGGGEGGGGIMATIKPYKTYIVLGVALLAVVIAYQLYSRRASQKKDEAQIDTGLKNIQGAIAHEQNAEQRPKVEVDPQVIEVLQGQVLAYQAQVQEMDAALAQATQLLRQFGYGPSSQGSGPGPQGQGQMGGIDPQMAAAMQQQHQQQGGGMPPVGGGHPTRGGPSEQQPSMGAFAGQGEPMPALQGMSSQMGGMEY
jgi:hypothetical protein